MSQTDFENTIKDYLVFDMKKELDILSEEINEFDMLELINSYYSEVEDEQNEHK